MHTARRWQICVFVSTSVLASFNIFAQSASTRRDQAADLTRGFLSAHAELLSSADPAATLAGLSTLAEERRSAMAALVATEPASFLSLAISSQMRDALPAPIRNRIEEHIEIEGDLEVMTEDYDWGSITRYHVRTVGRGRLALHFAADPPDLLSDQRVRVRGVLLDADMAVASGAADVELLASVLPSTFGEQSTLLMLVNFTDNTSQPFSLATASDLLLNTVSSFYRENSQNQTWIGGDVVGWFTINVSAGVCDTTAIMNGAKAAASGAGVNLSRYRRFVVTFPQNACGFAGMGNVGGNPTNAWINGGSFGTRTLGHELGHNLGLHHAHALECGSSTLGSGCSTITYGNPVDIMGVPGIVGHFNAFAKERLGWLDYGSSAPLLKVTSAGTFTLSPYASTLSGMKALKVLKSMSGTVPTYYYVEYRHGANFDSSVPAGVFVHTGVEGNGDTSLVLDMTPETESWNDAALPTGRTFSDPASGVSITTMSVSGTGATVRIDFGGPLPCSYSLNSGSQSMGAAGGTGSVTVTTDSSCAWGATSNASWLTPWAASGTGSATVQYSVAANTSASARTGTITIGGQPHTVTQAAAAQTCSYSLNSASQSMGAAGGTGSVTVTTAASCGWGVSSNASWLTPWAASGTGSATLQYSVAANTSASARTGTITISGQPHTVTQAAGAQTCSYTLNSSSQSVGAAGGTGSVTVTTDASCAWGVFSNASWLTPWAASGTGSATLQYSVAANTSASARTGTITIGGQLHTVTQAAGAQTCSYSLNAASQSMGAAGGTGSVTVTTAASCGWGVSSNASWLTPWAASGTGSATLQYSVAANTSGSARTGTITISGQPHTVTQAAAVQTCSYTLNSSSQSVGAAAGTGSVTVTTDASCAWGAFSNASWLTPWAASGTGSATVQYSVAANTSASARTGTITIGGQLHTVTQAAAAQTCSYSLNAASQSMGAAGGTGSVTVTTAASCGWGVSSNASWLTPWAASGTGSATLQYSVAANTSASARTGTITISGQPHTVTQAAAGQTCSYTLNSASQSVGAAAGTGSVTVTTDASCAWGVFSNASWLTPWAASGTGSATVQYSVAANTSASARTGTITIGGQPHTVTQAAAAAAATENHAPTMASLSAQRVSVGEVMTFTISASDPDGDTLTYSASNMPSGAVLSASTGAFHWLPTSAQAGTYNVTFSVSDGQLSASQTVKLTVSRPNGKTQ